MTLEKYLDLRKIFLQQYMKSKVNEFGFVSLSNFTLSNFDLFIWLYSIENVTTQFGNNVSSISFKKWYVKFPKRPVDKIKIGDIRRSIFDKWPEQFETILKSYDKQNIKT